MKKYNPASYTTSDEAITKEEFVNTNLLQVKILPVSFSVFMLNYKNY